MLGFHELFWHAEKRGENAEKAENTRKNSRKTADSENFFADVVRCGYHPHRRGTLRTPISKRGRVALWTQIICPPLVIMSGWDLHFTGKFWRSFFDLLGMDLWFSAVFHPQAHGQLERMIQTLENFLRPYVERHP